MMTTIYIQGARRIISDGNCQNVSCSYCPVADQCGSDDSYYQRVELNRKYLLSCTQEQLMEALL